ncbi:MAG: DEAD/DEAH box helicase [Gammaproteobacteria bacterium]
MSFKSTGLKAELLRAVEKQGYSEPTTVQAQTIPSVIERRDVLAGAQTGTGKTAAFALPILHNLSCEKPVSGWRAPRSLVLTPTRELADQVTQSFKRYGDALNLNSTAIFGGVGVQPQKKALKKGVDIVVATPGRLLDHASEGSIDLTQIEIFVLDEADRMLDMGFIHDLRRVIDLLPSKRQNLMFSATYTPEIRKLADGYLNDPVRVEVKRKTLAADTVHQVAYRVERSAKRHLLTQLIEDGNWFQVLVFARTKYGAERLAKQLQRAGVEADAIHGDKSQNARLRALKAFKDGSLRVLVGTDVAARGLDIGGLEHVVNFDLPNVPDDYVHRIGRTGRAGKTGHAISLVSSEESKLLKAIETRLKTRIEFLRNPEFTAPISNEARVSADKSQAQRGDGGQQRPQGNKAGAKTKRKPKSSRRRSRGQDRSNAGAENGSKGQRRSGRPGGKQSSGRRAQT